jgi:Transposase
VLRDPRRNALLKEGNKSDQVDARKLADLLRTGMLRPVYHGEHGLRTLRELGRSYQTLSRDLNRVMNTTLNRPFLQLISERKTAETPAPRRFWTSPAALTLQGHTGETAGRENRPFLRRILRRRWRNPPLLKCGCVTGRLISYPR